MCGSTVDIQSATAEISRGKKEKKKKRKKKKKPQDENIMACPITYGGHNNNINDVVHFSTSHIAYQERISKPTTMGWVCLGRNKFDTQGVVLRWVNGGQINSARCFAVSCAGTLYIHFGGSCP